MVKCNYRGISDGETLRKTPDVIKKGFMNTYGSKIYHLVVQVLKLVKLCYTYNYVYKHVLYIKNFGWIHVF